MAVKKSKISFAAIFTSAVLAIIVFVVAIFMLIFVMNLRSVTSQDAQSNVSERIAHLKDNIGSVLEKYESVLGDVSFGIAALLSRGEIPMAEMNDYIANSAVRFPEIEMIYYFNNYRWNTANGYYASSNNWTPPETWDNTVRPWFTNAKKAQGKAAYSDPYVDANTGDIIISVSTMVNDRNRRDIGVVAADVLVTDLGELLKNSLIMPEQNLFLVNSEGLFITHSDVRAVMERNFFRDFNLGQYQSRVFGTPIFSVMDRDIFLYTAQIPAAGWYLVSIIPRKVIFADINSFIMRLIMLSIVILAVMVAGTAVFTFRMLTAPFKELLRVADALAEMDFSVDFKKFRQDEIGDIQHALIKIRDSLRKGIETLQENIAKTEAEGQKLNTMVTDSMGALEAITTGIETMDNRVRMQMESVKTTANTAAEISVSAGDFNKTVHDQNESISESSRSVEQLAAYIQTIQDVVHGTSKTTETLSKSSESGHKMLLKLVDELKYIEEESETLRKANSAIADITAQTNILAMNAAIEAAHAGEAGRGFAVVAGEVRKLGELSGKESESISSEIKKMEMTIRQIDTVSKETTSAMDVIFREIKTLGASFANVNQAVEEQAQGSSRTLSMLKNVQEMTGYVRTGAEAMHKQSTSIHMDMEKLREISSEVSEKVHSMRTASANIAQFMDNIRKMGR